jgi:hypothetical protein
MPGIWTAALILSPLQQDEFVRLKNTGRTLVGQIVSQDDRTLRLRSEGETHELAWEQILPEDARRLRGEGFVRLDGDREATGDRIFTRFRVLEGRVVREDETSLWLETAESAKEVPVPRAGIERRQEIRLPEWRLLSLRSRLNRRADDLASGDLAGWRRLIELCLGRRLISEAREFARRGGDSQAALLLNRLESIEEPIRMGDDPLVYFRRLKERYEAIRGLAKDRHPLAEAALLGLLRSGELPAERYAALFALRELARRESVPPLIEILAAVKGELKEAVNDALVAITGVDKHGSVEAWRAWWEASGEEFLAGRYVPSPAERPDSGSTKLFYGLPVESRRVVFAVDRSGSMADLASYAEMKMILTEQPGASAGFIRRIDVARWQLKRALGRLPAEALFNLVFFNLDAERLSPTMLEASKENVERAAKFVDSIEPVGGTDMVRALEAALASEERPADTVFLLSDGLPTGQTPGELLSQARKLNGPTKRALHTVFIGSAVSEEFDRGKELMERLAAEHGGRSACLGVRPE